MENNEPFIEDFIDRYDYMQLVYDVPQLGFFHLNVADAAVLIATDQWFNGEISLENELPDADSYDPKDPEIQQALSKHIKIFRDYLIDAINKGSLKTTKIMRNFSEEIVLQRTLIEFSVLSEWLNEHGYSFGDGFYDYEKEESKAFEDLVSEAFAIRVKWNHLPIFPEFLIDSGENSEKTEKEESKNALKKLEKKYQVLSYDHMLLKKKLRDAKNTDQKQIEPPLTTRKRRTLLTIIAALCNGAGINYQDRGAAQRIGELTEEIGAPVTDDTIRSIISDIDDAVETRMR